MTKEKQQITIAKACGWKDVKVTNHEYVDVDSRSITYWSGLTGIPPEFIHYEQRIRVPDYLNDLNAINDAVLSILNSATSQLNWDYCRILGGVTGSGNHVTTAIIHATAAQRAKALLKALNLWEASK